MDILSYLYLCLLPMALGSEQHHSNYSVLILTSIAAPHSHSIYFDGIAQQLASRGHQVTHHCIGGLESNPHGVNNYEVKAINQRIGSVIFFDLNTIQDYMRFSTDVLPTFIEDAINTTYNDPLLVDLVKQPRHNITNKPKYDVVLIDAVVGEIYLPLAHHIGVPYILVSNIILAFTNAWKSDIPYHYFNNYLGLPNSLSVLNRLIHFVSIAMTSVYYNFASQWIGQLTRMYLPNAPPMDVLLKNVSFIMTANSDSLIDSSPSTPIGLHTGCAQCRQAQQLPMNLEKIMQMSGDHGVIYFSMGTFVNSNAIPKEFKEKVIRVLSRLNQTILWKGRLSETHPSNFHVNEWFPQQDVLAHPKVLFTITHGGLGTIHEAAYHGCPILGFALNFDQNYNVYISKKNGFGEYLNWRSFTEDDLHETITRILTNKSYKEAAMRTSIRMRDSLDSPCEQAAYWTEYIVRHKGAPFLSHQSHRLHWHQYFLLDVFALLLTVTAIAFTLAWLTLKSAMKAILNCAKMFMKWISKSSKLA